MTTLLVPPQTFVDASSNQNYSSLKLSQIGPITQGYNQIFPTYYVQNAWDKTLVSRYAESNNIKDFIVGSTDGPFHSNSSTAPRTEMRFETINNYTKTYVFKMSFYAPSTTTDC